MIIRQNNLTIRNATAEDVKILGKWWRDGKVMAHAGFPNGLNIKDEEIKKQLSEDSDKTKRRLIIEIREKAIGEMSYRNMGDSRAQIGIKICDFSEQGKGYGTELIRMLIGDLFNTLGYSKIMLDTNLNNTRAQYIYEKIGFLKTAVNYDVWKNQLGELQSSVEYELDKSDYLL